MIKYQKLITLLAVASLILAAGCSSSGKKSNRQHAGPASMGKAYAKDFLIGAALSATQIEGKDSIANVLVPSQFTTITPENIMKAEVIHPQWDKYDFALADLPVR